MSSGTSLGSYYERAIQAIIRPPKKTYSEGCLGPPLFNLGSGRNYRRIDQQIKHEGELIEISIFMLYDERFPCYVPPNLILFCHCNASNRLECMQYLQFLPKEYAIAGFDFIGCGNSSGDYITLGIKESQQIRTIVQVLGVQFRKLILWGRSMGAVSVLMYGEAAISVVDSPFYTLKSLGKDQVKSHASQAPKCLISCLFPCLWSCVKNDIKKRTNVDVGKLNTVNAVKKMNAHQTVIFISGRNDDLVSPKHTERLYNAFVGTKKALVMVEGGHNCRRSRETFAEVMRLIDSY